MEGISSGKGANPLTNDIGENDLKGKRAGSRSLSSRAGCKELLKHCEFRRLHQRLSADAIAHANFDAIVAGIQIARVEQAGQRQTLSRVAVTTPILSLLENLFAVFQQRIFDVDRRSQCCLIDSGVVN